MVWIVGSWADSKRATLSKASPYKSAEPALAFVCVPVSMFYSVFANGDVLAQARCLLCDHSRVQGIQRGISVVKMASLFLLCVFCLGV